MDASNLLKPALARGELRAIGATTLNEYRKRIEKDAALERRFQPIYTAQPSVEDTIAILRGLKERYEVHHGVRIRDDAIIAAAVLSDRYITSRFLPDKAIDLIDEAASRLKMEIESQPTELDRAERKILQLTIEKQALSKETDPASRERLAALDKELAEIGAGRDAMKLQWQNEKEIIEEIRKLKATLEELHIEETRYEREGNLSKAAEIKHGRIPEAQRQLDAKSAELESAARRDAPAARGGVRGGHRADRLQLDGHPRVQDALLGEAEVPEARGDPLPQGRRPGPGHRRRVGRHPAQQVGAVRHRRSPWARSSSSGPRAWERRSWPRRWPTSCSATRRR